VLRVRGDRALVEHDRLLVAPERLPQGAEIAQGIGVLRVVGEHCAELPPQRARHRRAARLESEPIGFSARAGATGGLGAALNLTVLLRPSCFAE